MTDPEAPEPPHLTEAYHKARKSYAFAAGLLLAWELIGIELTETPLTSVNVRLLSPAAAPYVLVVMTGYFFLRTTIEWQQVPSARRAVFAARMDYILANTIAGAAVAVFVLQRALNTQLFGMFAPELAPQTSEGFMITILVLLIGGMATTSLGLTNVLKMPKGKAGWMFFVGGTAFCLFQAWDGRSTLGHPTTWVSAAFTFVGVFVSAWFSRLKKGDRIEWYGWGRPLRRAAGSDPQDKS